MIYQTLRFSAESRLFASCGATIVRSFSLSLREQIVYLQIKVFVSYLSV